MAYHYLAIQALLIYWPQIIHHTDCGFAHALSNNKAHKCVDDVLCKTNGDPNVSTKYIPIQVIPDGDVNHNICKDPAWAHIFISTPPSLDVGCLHLDIYLDGIDSIHQAEV